jgi:hypothetical protein
MTPQSLISKIRISSHMFGLSASVSPRLSLGRIMVPQSFCRSSVRPALPVEATFSPVLLVNIIFIAGLFVVLGVYLFSVNSITAYHYRIDTLNVQLTALQENMSNLSGAVGFVESQTAVTDFANLQGMVEGRDGAHIFDNRIMALR